MIEEFKPFYDYLNQAAIVISQHSLGCSITEPSELKVARKQYLFSLIEFLQSHLDNETFERLIYTDNDTPLYCYSVDSFQYLSKSKNAIYLCTSKEKDIGIGGIPSKGYKHYYEFKIKPNSYGIDIEKFLSIFTEEELIKLHSLLYYYDPECGRPRQFNHENEKEVIIDVHSLELVRELKL